MPFENFEQKEPENNQRALFIIFCIVFVPLSFFWIFKQFSPGLREDPPQVNHTIAIDEVRTIRIGKLCAGLPKPEKFEFVGSTDNSGFDYSMVIFRYRSIRGMEEIMPAFLVWFDENGWSRIPDTSTFEKGKQKIYISASFNDQFTQYEIYCSEKE